MVRRFVAASSARADFAPLVAQLLPFKFVFEGTQTEHHNFGVPQSISLGWAPMSARVSEDQ